MRLLLVPTLATGATMNEMERCFERIQDGMFKLSMHEEDMMRRKGMDTTTDYTIYFHRVNAMGTVSSMLAQVGNEFVSDFDNDRFLTATGF